MSKDTKNISILVLIRQCKALEGTKPQYLSEVITREYSMMRRKIWNLLVEKVN